ncbi:hypothetical protein H920_00100 [Fukomys damarensis]|uniref:Protein kinase domain-containing protein n=1 Tax=Fukomys damarensis TaxID=885580 RepID=A0A091ERP1_FUKDA|nr:hypothetical protein H920_00100 [Fukomys damarensis]
MYRYRLQDNYDVLGLIDQGSFGKVLVQHHGALMQVAVKKLTKAEVPYAYITMEIGIPKDLQHPNFTQLLKTAALEAPEEGILESSPEAEDRGKPWPWRPYSQNRSDSGASNTSISLAQTTVAEDPPKGSSFPRRNEDPLLFFREAPVFTLTSEVIRLPAQTLQLPAQTL